MLYNVIVNFANMGHLATSYVVCIFEQTAQWTSYPGYSVPIDLFEKVFYRLMKRSCYRNREISFIEYYVRNKQIRFFLIYVDIVTFISTEASYKIYLILLFAVYVDDVVDTRHWSLWNYRSLRYWVSCYLQILHS